ncbi:MAG: extracellular solute-binding protein [Microcystis aeruginosa Ma_MB_F_20061100_S20]|uniref:Extracellular solute-binding protein n=1 Tax=Microcystis aeruginosa Ma_MB_F_20061100_S20D TaxID=2486253 RepID=A0A552EG94_MICAE|nr:MAG: extracellular solute-binding protein [Microcystis aeruginosa Ma_MB_F_20061100_S20]TRU33467.1 MAG: extracellular solute-binding protein [Microcystis aeruginosa Ma_MB_F_20061100_S20D]
MLNRRSFLQGLGTIALAGGLNGCASGSSEPSIFLLSGSIPPRLLTDFQKTIAEKKVNFQSERQLKELLELLEKWLKNQGQPTSQFSIPIPFREQNPAIGNLVTLGDAWLGKAITNGLIQPLDTSQLSNWSKLPPRWQENMTRNAQGQLQTEGKVWGAPYRWGMTVIAYNEKKFAQFDWRPQDWSDLWRPELTGKIALIDNRREVIGLTLKKLGYSYNSSDLKQVMGLKDQLFALQKQVRFYSSQYYLQPLILGDVWLSVGWSNDILPVSDRYNKIKVVVPKSGTSLWSDVWVKPVLTTPNSLVQQWIDFCWQPESATKISLFTSGLSPLILTENPDQIPPDIKNNPLLVNPEAIKKSDFLNPLSPATEQEYEQLWQAMRQLV